MGIISAAHQLFIHSVKGEVLYSIHIEIFMSM